MARLNDPPVQVESLDALKRRFIRQNREIARVNSTQSLRIRNLETEISRLLSENISLREQAIAAVQEAERWRNARQLGEDVHSMKDRLEAKLQEVSALVNELGGLPGKAAKRSSAIRRQTTTVEQVGSPNERNWRNKQTIAGVLGGESEEQDGRLPPILEDKHYPRRTLEATEIRSLRDNSALDQVSESPDLGPPPVAHFDVTESPHFDADRSPRRQSMGDVEDNDFVTLPRNLETRRKRRTSSLLQELPVDPTAKERAEDDLPLLLKSGAKRKLDESELERVEKSQPNGKDDFVFQRKSALTASTVSAKRGSRFSRAPTWQPQTDGSSNPSSPQKELQPTRKVLAPKSTNSPSKRKVTVGEKPAKESDVGATRQRTERPTAQHVNFETTSKAQKGNSMPEDILRTKRQEFGGRDADLELPPKTPAALDELMSPFSTEPSFKKDVRPQEAAILNSVEDVLNGSIGRGSRRARAAVSYAEPNLRDKMRRPGKELVGAVEGIDRSREGQGRASSSDRNRGQSEDAGMEYNLNNAVNIKQEKGVEDAKWTTLPMASKKEEPASPLSDKKRVTVKTQSCREAVDRVEAELEKAVNRLSIFDPPLSSPASAEGDKKTHGKELVAAHAPIPVSNATIKRKQSHPTTASSSTRRHSMLPSTLPANSAVLKSSSQQPPRPSSAASARSDSGKATMAATAAAVIDLKRTSSSSALKRDEAGLGRNDRAASRRRSMMI